jgi:malate dehydrogenase (quinone)
VTISESDVALIGSGVMSANLGAMLKRLDPGLKIQVYEVTDALAQESSHGWNNAGTGHAGLCELSYTPDRAADGTVKVDKAIEIFEQFERSRQFWAYGVRTGMLGRPSTFINPVSHLSFVYGPQQVDYLAARFAALKRHHFFKDMAYSVDRAEIARWAPLLVENRDPAEPIAVTKAEHGTDVNFGELSRQLLGWLGAQAGCQVAGGHRVVDLIETADGWDLKVKVVATGEEFLHRSRFVFIGAGGGSILLLQKAGVAEAKGLGGFPIGGQWLVCTKPEIVRRHEAKVYGQPLDAAPTMAVPHLDTRVLDGKKALLFGPFAAWTTKFLHLQGSRWDLFNSVKADNLGTLMKVGAHNLELVRYLIQQGTQSMAERIRVLRLFYPAAQAEDWKLVDGGIRVQAIKKTDGEAGIVHYGTEVITNSRRTLSALLGASPGSIRFGRYCVRSDQAVFSPAPGLAASQGAHGRDDSDVGRSHEAAGQCRTLRDVQSAG